MSIRGDGVISVTANVVPQTMAAIQAHLNNNNIKQAKALELDLVALHRDLFIESNPIAVKWALYYLKKYQMPYYVAFDYDIVTG